MNLSKEQGRLSSGCQSFVDMAKSLPEEQFYQQVNGKWSMAQILQHLYLSARPVARLMAGSRDQLLQWGKPDRQSMTYDQLADSYQKILATGVKAPVTMSPRPEDMQVDMYTILERFTSIYQALIDAVSTWADHELDEYIIPHPALGKLTVREMLHFTSAHTEHHLRLLPNA